MYYEGQWGSGNGKLHWDARTAEEFCQDLGAYKNELRYVEAKFRSAICQRAIKLSLCRLYCVCCSKTMRSVKWASEIGQCYLQAFSDMSYRSIFVSHQPALSAGSSLPRCMTGPAGFEDAAAVCLSRHCFQLVPRLLCNNFADCVSSGWLVGSCQDCAPAARMSSLSPRILPTDTATALSLSTAAAAAAAWRHHCDARWCNMIRHPICCHLSVISNSFQTHMQPVTFARIADNEKWNLIMI